MLYQTYQKICIGLGGFAETLGTVLVSYELYNAGTNMTDFRHDDPSWWIAGPGLILLGETLRVSGIEESYRIGRLEKMVGRKFTTKDPEVNNQDY